MHSYRAGLAILAIAAFATSVHAQAPAPEQGKILSVNGRVEHTRAQQEQWNAAKVFQPLLTAERVRTLEASRASILFVDESQVKLNANAARPVPRWRRLAAGTPSAWCDGAKCRTQVAAHGHGRIRRHPDHSDTVLDRDFGPKWLGILLNVSKNPIRQLR